MALAEILAREEKGLDRLIEDLGRIAARMAELKEDEYDICKCKLAGVISKCELLQKNLEALAKHVAEIQEATETRLSVLAVRVEALEKALAIGIQVKGGN